MDSILSYALVSALGITLASCGKHKTESSGAASHSSPVAVRTIKVAWSEVPLFEVSMGAVQPYRRADVSAKVTGRVLTMLAVPGKRAEEGELLAEIDAAELRSALTQAVAARDQAKRDFERVSALLPKNAISRSDFEQAQARYEGAVAAAEEAEHALSNAEVRAPFSGVITRKDMDPGDLAMPGKPLFVMEDFSRLRLETHVAESLAGTLKTGDKIRITVETAGVDTEGVVSEISPSADVGSRTFLVKIDLPADPALRAGQFGRAHIPRGRHRALEVPESAVTRRGQMEIAFVVKDGKAGMRLVRTGPHDGGRVEILSGLEPGEFLVVAPDAGLRDGDPVTSADR